MTQRHEKLEECMKIFVSWQWGVGFITAFIVVLVSVAWAGSARLTKIETKIVQTEQAISILQDVNAKIDSLLKR